MHYEHPLFDSDSLKVKKKIRSIQGEDNLFFAGAYNGYGFHEDGLTSAKNIAELINNEI